MIEVAGQLGVQKGSGAKALHSQSPWTRKLAYKLVAKNATATVLRHAQDLHLLQFSSALSRNLGLYAIHNSGTDAETAMQRIGLRVDTVHNRPRDR